MNATQEVRRLYNVKEHLLGAGAFGKVYLAESKENSNVKFAIKVMPTKNLTPTLRELMNQELEILYKLDHPYICQYVESFMDQKYIYIVMELCPGKILFDVLEEKGKFSEKEAATLMYKVIEGLNHIHSVDIIHRDLKPENLMVDSKGDPKIIDFGLSKDITKFKALKSYVGSKLYMAPEILSGFAHNNVIDMWSIGIILFLILTNNYPFDLNNLDHEILETPVLFIP